MQETAFGLCGVSVEQFNRMTPAELTRMAEARIKYRDADQQFLDTLNGMVCSILAATNGVKDAKPANYMITRRETEEKEDDPVKQVERIGNQLKAWAGMSGGSI